MTSEMERVSEAEMVEWDEWLRDDPFFGTGETESRAMHPEDSVRLIASLRRARGLLKRLDGWYLAGGWNARCIICDALEHAPDCPLAAEIHDVPESPQ